MSQTCENIFTELEDVIRLIQEDHLEDNPDQNISDNIVLLMCRVSPARIHMAPKFRFLFSSSSSLSLFDESLECWRRAKNKARQRVFCVRPSLYPPDATMRYSKFVSSIDDATIVIIENLCDLNAPCVGPFLKKCGPVATGQFLRRCVADGSFNIPGAGDLVVYNKQMLMSNHAPAVVRLTSEMIARAKRTVVDTMWM